MSEVNFSNTLGNVIHQRTVTSSNNTYIPLKLKADGMMWPKLPQNECSKGMGMAHFPSPYEGAYIRRK